MTTHRSRRRRLRLRSRRPAWRSTSASSSPRAASRRRPAARSSDTAALTCSRRGASSRPRSSSSRRCRAVPRERRTILLTGASGVIGRAIIDELGDHRLIGLVHSTGDPPDIDEVIRGDLAEPRFGLSAEQWRSLEREVDAIVHSGALTQWGQERERYEAVNVGGTRTVIELALAAGAPVHLLSTIFVLALTSPDRGLSPGNLVENYIWSKLESARLLKEDRLPHPSYRPPHLVGDSRTGA